MFYHWFTLYSYSLKPNKENTIVAPCFKLNFKKFPSISDETFWFVFFTTTFTGKGELDVASRTVPLLPHNLGPK
jgi:hypothetical protein